MNLTSTKAGLAERPILIGGAVIALFWALESILEAFVFHQGSFINRLFPKDIHEIWMRVFVIGIFIMLSVYIQFVLTGRKRTEEALRKLSRAVEQSPASIVITDTQGNIEYVNPKFTEVTGYRLDEVLGKNPRILKSGETPSDEYKRLWETITIGKEWRGEFHNKKKNGQLYWESASISSITNDEGTTTHFLAVKEEITEKKRLEATLRQSEEKYRSLFEESLDAIFLRTPDGKFLDINPAGVALLGYDSKEEVLQADITRGLFINREEREKYERKLSQDGFVRNYELTLNRKDGQKVTVLETATAVRDAAGNIVAYRGILHDITEHKKLQEQFLQAQKMETIGTLIGGVAHDFNNLLTVILGNAEFGLQDSTPEEPAYQDFVEIEKSASQARDLTKQLLSFSRRQTLEPKVVNVNQTTENLLKMLNRIIREDIELKARLDPTLAPIWADPVQIQQVMMNVLVNARDAMPQGGRLLIETRNVTARSDFPRELRVNGSHSEDKRGSKSFVEITITDSGCGMDKATRARIFEPFFTTKEAGKGTGLGLSVVYGIVKQHGGHIEVFSELSSGTTFKLYFPAASLPAAFGQRTTELEPTLSGGETVLLVEDDEAVRNVAVRILKKFGYNVLPAEDGMQAMTVFKQKAKDIDVAILDVGMPKISGPDLYENLSSMQPNLPVIFATGYDVRPKIEEWAGTAQAPVVVLQKPYTKNALAQKVREILDYESKSATAVEYGYSP